MGIDDAELPMVAPVVCPGEAVDDLLGREPVAK